MAAALQAPRATALLLSPPHAIARHAQPKPTGNACSRVRAGVRGARNVATECVAQADAPTGATPGALTELRYKCANAWGGEGARVRAPAARRRCCRRCCPPHPPLCSPNPTLPPRRVMLKVSGEALEGRQGYGIDPGVLQQIASEVAAAASEGVQVAVVVGGGNFFRGVDRWEGLDRATADYVGMLATVSSGGGRGGGEGGGGGAGTGATWCTPPAHQPSPPRSHPPRS